MINVWAIFHHIFACLFVCSQIDYHSHFRKIFFCLLSQKDYHQFMFLMMTYWTFIHFTVVHQMNCIGWHFSFFLDVFFWWNKKRDATVLRCIKEKNKYRNKMGQRFCLSGIFFYFHLFMINWTKQKTISTFSSVLLWWWFQFSQCIFIIWISNC